MNRVFGKKECYVPIREDESRTIISYDYVAEEDGVNATWYEIYVYKVEKQSIGFNEVCDAIIEDINHRTDEKILSGFVWTCQKGEDKDKVFNVWLSTENQFNYKAAYDLAVQTQGQSLPVKFKLGEKEVEVSPEEEGEDVIWHDTEKIPQYHVFEDMDDFTDFYLKTIAYVNQCLNEGWAKKDSMDFEPYRRLYESDVEEEGKE